MAVLVLTANYSAKMRDTSYG